ncbi:MAG: pentapeptide repeat-containing protein, partial [Methylobacter sp.]
LLAEYLLGVFLQAAAKQDHTLDQKVRLCIGTISTETADFLINLLDGLTLAVDQESYIGPFCSFLKTATINCKPLLREIADDRNIFITSELILSVCEIAQQFYEDDKPIFIDQRDYKTESRYFFRYLGTKLSMPCLSYPIYNERWIALLVASVLWKRLTGQYFNEQYLNTKKSYLLRDLIMSSSHIPLWSFQLFHKSNLSEINLNGHNLSGVDLSETILIDSYLNRTNLAGANLYKANLDRANLFMANLERATLKEASLRAANLTMANLQGANLKGADFHEVALYGASFQGAKLDGADFTGASLAGCDMDPQQITYASKRGAIIYESRFSLGDK